MIDVLGFVDAAETAILATIDGARVTVPNDMGNRHRQAIALWEMEGHTIPAFEPPEMSLPNLHPDQFWFGLRVAGYEDDVRAWVASMNDPENPGYDPIAWAAASAKLEFATYFERNHPLVEAARNHLGLTTEQLDDLWVFVSGAPGSQ